MLESIRLRDGRTVRVRRAAGPDADALHHHFQSGLTKDEREARRAPTLAGIRRRLREPHRFWYLALTEGGDLVAEVAYLHDTIASHDAVVSVSVAGGWRGSGLASKLIRATWPQPGSIERVLARVKAGNEASRRLFDRLLAELGGDRRVTHGILVYTLPVGPPLAAGGRRGQSDDTARSTVLALASVLRPRLTDPGDRVPTVGALARQYGVSPLVAARVYKLLESEGVLESLGRGKGRGWRVARRNPDAISSRSVEIATAIADAIRTGEMLAGDVVRARDVAANHHTDLTAVLDAFDPLVARGLVIGRGTVAGPRYVVAAAGFDWHPFCARQLVSGATLDGIAAAEVIGMIDAAAALSPGVARIVPKPLLVYPEGGRFRLFFLPDRRRRLLLLAAGGRGSRRASLLAARLTEQGRRCPEREALDDLPLSRQAVVWGRFRWRGLGQEWAIAGIARGWYEGDIVLSGIAEADGLTFVGLPHRKLLVVAGRAGHEAAHAAAGEVLAVDQYVRSHEASREERR